jgi:hypothetical protein
MDSQLAAFKKGLSEADEARRAVRPVVGDVIAQDSAAEIYGFALDHLKVDEGVTEVPALKALFALASSRSAATAPRIAQDAAGLASKFPNATASASSKENLPCLFRSQSISQPARSGRRLRFGESSRHCTCRGSGAYRRSRRCDCRTVCLGIGRWPTVTNYGEGAVAPSGFVHRDQQALITGVSRRSVVGHPRRLPGHALQRRRFLR